MKLGIKIGNYVAYLKICLDYCKFLNIKKYLFLPRSNCKTGQEGIILYVLAVPQILFYDIVLPVICHLLTYKTLDRSWVGNSRQDQYQKSRTRGYKTPVPVKGTSCDEMNILLPNDSIRFVRLGYKI